MKRRNLIVVVSLVLTACLLLAGCGAYKSAGSGASATSPSMPPMYNGGAAYDYQTSDSAYPEAGVPGESIAQESGAGPTGSAPIGTDTNLAEKIIYTANISIETTDYDASVASLNALVQEHGGFMESSGTSGYASYEEDGSAVIRNRYGYFTVRIPSQSFDAFMQTASQTSTLGNVVDASQSAENITAKYTDFELRLQSLETQYDTLLELLDKSTKLEDVITLQSRISDVTYEIESIKSILRNYDRQVSYSTVNISLREVSGYTNTVSVTSTFGERVKTAFANTGRNFVRSFQNFIIGFIYALPTLIILAVIVVVIVLVVLGIARRRKARRSGEPVKKWTRRLARKAKKPSWDDREQPPTDT